MTRNVFLCGALACCLAGAGSAAGSGVAPGLNRFSTSVYEQVAKGSNRNLVLSPFSVANVLSMVLTGARGGTADEIAKVLGQGKVDPQYHADLAALVAQIAKASNVDGNQLLNANRVWVQKDFPTLPDFRDTLRNVYQAPAAPLDFMHDLEQARTEINTWTDQNTRGKIHELFAPGVLDSRTRLVLTSAVYFYGQWEHPFQRTNTRPAPFTLPGGGTEQTDFMNQTGRFGYGETAAGQVLEMNYAGTGLAFDILLPKKGAAMDGAEDLTGWLGSLQPQRVQVSVPKFRVESEFPLVEVLSKLGMPSAFDRAADFSGIDDRRDLRLSQVIHKAYIDVAEEGTEAAAATGGVVSLTSMMRTQEPVFRADHPFRFAIRDTKTGLVLFTGRVMDPKR